MRADTCLYPQHPITSRHTLSNWANTVENMKKILVARIVEFSICTNCLRMSVLAWYLYCMCVANWRISCIAYIFCCCGFCTMCGIIKCMQTRQKCAYTLNRAPLTSPTMSHTQHQCYSWSENPPLITCSRIQGHPLFAMQHDCIRFSPKFGVNAWFMSFKSRTHIHTRKRTHINYW